METPTILVIDDSPPARETARAAAALLEGCQPRLVLARSGMEAVQLLRDPPQVDLVLLDVHLPGADVDGRLLGSLIREALPQAVILPFTGDRQPQTVEVLRALGMEEPVFKPVAPEMLAERMREALEQSCAGEPLAIQPFLAGQALQLAELLEQRARRSPLSLALLAHSHLARAGLAHVLGEIGHILPVEIAVASGQAEPIRTALRGGGIDLLVCASDTLAEGDSLHRTHGLPLLIYAGAADARPALASRHSVLVGPTVPEELARALQMTLEGDQYRDPQVEAVLGLTPRQHQIVTMLAHCATTAQIARAVGLSPDRLRHVLTDLYDQLDLPHIRPALIAWAQAAPLHLCEEA